MTQSSNKRKVLFDHDGGVDDLLSLMMLLAMPHIDLVGIVVTPADCFLRPAVSASLKILRFFNRLDIELSEGTLYGVNPFPRAWRMHAYAIDALPILNELPQTDKAPPKSDKTDLTKIPGFMDLSSERNFGRAALVDLKNRLQPKLETKLSADTADVEHQRRTLQELYEQVLAQENIILSRVERNRLLAALTQDIFQQLPGNLPTPLSEPGHQFIARKLREADEPLTILITGPVSNLAKVLADAPDLVEKIEQVVWMGGAINVEGNVRDYEHDGSAEWNAYWDPPATYSLWQTAAPITLFSLDATKQVAVKPEFLHRLAQQRAYPLSDLAGQCWVLTVGAIPSYEYIYYMWDTLTTGYLGAPQYMTFRQVRSQVVPYGPSAGRIKEVTQGGKLVQVAAKVDVEGFQNYLLELFRS